MSSNFYLFICWHFRLKRGTILSHIGFKIVSFWRLKWKSDYILNWRESVLFRTQVLCKDLRYPDFCFNFVKFTLQSTLVKDKVRLTKNINSVMCSLQFNFTLTTFWRKNSSIENIDMTSKFDQIPSKTDRSPFKIVIF